MVTTPPEEGHVTYAMFSSLNLGSALMVLGRSYMYIGNVVSEGVVGCGDVRVMWGCEGDVGM